MKMGRERESRNSRRKLICRVMKNSNPSFSPLRLKLDLFICFASSTPFPFQHTIFNAMHSAFTTQTFPPALAPSASLWFPLYPLYIPTQHLFKSTLHLYILTLAQIYFVIHILYSHILPYSQCSVTLKPI